MIFSSPLYLSFCSEDNKLQSTSLNTWTLNLLSILLTGCSKGFENLCLEEGDVEPIDISGQEGNMFDEAIGHIEDVLMGNLILSVLLSTFYLRDKTFYANVLCSDPQFQDLQKNFMEKYWNEFDDSEENKLVYMEIFKEYVCW